MATYHKLKNCPYCGSKAKAIRYAHHWIVQCSNQECQSTIAPVQMNKNVTGMLNLVDRWNDREMENNLVKSTQAVIEAVESGDQAAITEAINQAKRTIATSQETAWIVVVDE